MIFVIPAKAGIRTLEAKFATRNQVQIADSGSLPPLWACRGRLTEIKRESQSGDPSPFMGLQG